VKIPFIKIEGLGNDYLYIDRKSLPSKGANLPKLSRQMSDRHRGIGSDGLIIIEKSGIDSAFMEIYNSDGSKAEMCGNGLRGTLPYLKTVYKSKKKRFSISTKFDDFEVEFVKAANGEALVRASLGAPKFESKNIGYMGDDKNCLGITLNSLDMTLTLYCVAMPNPHAVIFVDNFKFDWRNVGMAIENSEIFKNRINVMFAKVESKNRISVIPWERGAGATMACGSGAAAVTVISNLLEYTKGEVTSQMPGGSLKTTWNIGENIVYQEGPTRIVFSGSINI
jgi:diaminopimelate epimerase